MLTEPEPFSTIVYERGDDGILTLTLNRPDRLNAFNVKMRDELVRAFDHADADDDVRVVVVTGAGRAFCAGGEVIARPEHSTRDKPAGYRPEDDRDDGGIVALRVFRCLKPVIAAVNGAAVGFGATFQLPMDVRLASEKARFGFPFASLGGLPEAAASWFLPRLVGMSRSIEWCLTGQFVSAAEAHEVGLIRSVHAPDELLPAAYVLARTIAEKAAPVSAAVTRQMMWRLAAAEHPMEAHIIESRLLHDRKLSADMREGVAAFLEKRPPAFPDRVSADLPSSFPWWTEERYH